jgi:hypothetical protein
VAGCGTGRGFWRDGAPGSFQAHHSPAQVTPLILRAAGAISKEDDALLPCPATGTGVTGRVELSTILLKYRCKLAWQIWSRRCPVVQQARLR